ncbi:hypothetical protein DNL40_02560 [Xylanimonas oleitrophica]|uniref:Uncharacterized protein n=1 Tax=Xylanimonas oleitrophica TaxID=2607479 RepID=A0A2W5WX87_9MICO|nr:hypothetical protein [Xylanimonas oleitrophica]PZR55272.1 hypothetical protein DNL40_02560 [Xylanimonas oleitrophica]
MTAPSGYVARHLGAPAPSTDDSPTAYPHAKVREQVAEVVASHRGRILAKGRGLATGTFYSPQPVENRRPVERPRHEAPVAVRLAQVLRRDLADVLTLPSASAPDVLRELALARVSGLLADAAPRGSAA